MRFTAIFSVNASMVTREGAGLRPDHVTDIFAGLVDLDLGLVRAP